MFFRRASWLSLLMAGCYFPASTGDPSEVDSGVVSTGGGTTASGGGIAAGGGGTATGGGQSAEGVSILYLVPADATERADAPQKLTHALHALQAWTARQGDGGTFAIATPTVRVIRTTHTAAWYRVEPDGGTQTTTFQNNVVSDGFRAVNGSYSQPRRVWLMYVEADPTCGALYGGAALPGGTGVAVLPANDLRGLAGQPTVSTCTGMTEPTQPLCRWVGGLGHELGHSLGVPHPPGCDAQSPSCDSMALMWLGYASFPNTYWRADDLQKLSANDLFGHFPLVEPLASCP